MKDKALELCEIFETACVFFDGAGFCLQAADMGNPGVLSHRIPAIVNAAFACEVFLKTLLRLFDIPLEKEHKLKQLYKRLPQDIQERIKAGATARYGRWTDIWGQDYLDNISNAFIKWRYHYEHDWSKSCVMHIEIGFLFAFGKSLRGECCKELYRMGWGEYRRYYGSRGGNHEKTSYAL